MTEDTAAGFQREGEITIPDTTAEDSAADSQSESTNQNEGTQSSEGENTQSENKETPFHEHPRWKQREDEWNTRFNSQEQRHQDDLKAIREEFGTQRKENAENTKIPAWFGGTQEQWNDYRADRDAELKKAGEDAIERLKSDQKSSTESQSNAVKEATDFMNSEVTAIETDKALNPTGATIDKEALLKVVVENELIDTKGRWNYRAGIKILNGLPKATTEQKKPDTTERKTVAAATTSEGRGDDKKPNYATSDTFKKDRPW